MENCEIKVSPPTIVGEQRLRGFGGRVFSVNTGTARGSVRCASTLCPLGRLPGNLNKNEIVIAKDGTEPELEGEYYLTAGLAAVMMRANCRIARGVQGEEKEKKYKKS